MIIELALNATYIPAGGGGGGGGGRGGWGVKNAPKKKKFLIKI
jgi:hypothetical protein